MLLTLSHLLALHTHLAQPRYMAPLSTFTSLSRLSLHNAVRSVSSIVPYNMPRELPPYMNISTSEKSTIQNKPVLRMLLFGKPCSGKGTLAARLSKKYDISTISTGDLLRQHIAARTDIGRQAEGIVAAGGLLPDEMMLDLITTKLDTLKETASIFTSSVCHAWLTRASIELDSRRFSTHTATGKAVGQLSRETQHIT
jgi:hypothetical protein